jgi:hypothetical protein
MIGLEKPTFHDTIPAARISLSSEDTEVQFCWQAYFFCHDQGDHMVLRDGAESQRAECKGAERQGAEPNDKLSTL